MRLPYVPSVTQSMRWQHPVDAAASGQARPARDAHQHPLLRQAPARRRPRRDEPGAVAAANSMRPTTGTSGARRRTAAVARCAREREVAAAARQLWDRDCGGLPVIDDRGHVHGMITDRDTCMAAMISGNAPRAHARCSRKPKATAGCAGDCPPWEDQTRRGGTGSTFFARAALHPRGGRQRRHATPWPRTPPSAYREVDRTRRAARYGLRHRCNHIAELPRP
jgi:hypothetical protein